ncbi:uncharacterized protein V6R79_022042 [Siganus canaliculatus]
MVTRRQKEQSGRMEGSGENGNKEEKRRRMKRKWLSTDGLSSETDNASVAMSVFSRQRSSAPAKNLSTMTLNMTERFKH